MRGRDRVGGRALGAFPKLQIINSGDLASPTSKAAPESGRVPRLNPLTRGRSFGRFRVVESEFFKMWGAFLLKKHFIIIDARRQTRHPARECGRAPFFDFRPRRLLPLSVPLCY